MLRCEGVLLLHRKRTPTYVSLNGYVIEVHKDADFKMAVVTEITLTLTLIGRY